ncbi:methyltransferase domain-containing protein [Chondromyces crocatus]|uniref:Methyltransferase domain-containing protein n=1 Tax=Chondromyces crocatus TaxID=52 RepID=A0A0K1ETQ5_CHOCO|nr:methyltransferase domain-containing protein [Chondromyces crocatus]AKT44032.1 uncharacterized protein CMC5_082700 [Chondromyces crocatus]
MNGQPPRDLLDGQAAGDDEESRPTTPHPDAMLPYRQEHGSVPASSRRRGTLAGAASAPPMSGTGDRAVAYSAIPGPAPLPRVPGAERLTGDDGAGARGPTTGRHRSRRSLRASDTPSRPSAPPSGEGAPVGASGPVSLSAPPPEVSDDDWGAPDVVAPSPQDSRPSSPQSVTPSDPELPAAQAATFDVGAAPALDVPTSVPNPLALRTIPRPARKPVSIPPTSIASEPTLQEAPLQPSQARADEAAEISIQPVKIIDVMSDLPPVESAPMEAIDEDLSEEEEAGFPLRVLADGPTPIDAREYLGSIETAPPPADDGAISEERSAIEEVEPESLDEEEMLAETRHGEPDAPHSEPEVISVPPAAHSDSAPEVDPYREGDSTEEISVDLTEDAVSTPRPPPPPPRRPQAMAALDLPPYTQQDASGAAIPAAPPPPPLKSASKPPAEHTPVADVDSPRRKKSWWEDLFSEDFIRTLDRAEPRVVRREADFIEERLGMERGAVILDLACGPGQHAVELASRGYSVVGYDLSLAMLALASDEAQERGQKLNFLQGDMREMAFEETFDAVYCWATSFGYFDEEKNADILMRIHRALRSGGMLLLDVINRDYVACRQPSLVWFEGEGCVCMDEMQVDFFTSRLKVKRTVMFEDGRSRELDYSIRIYNLHELGKILHEAGFKVTEVTGHPAHPGVFFGSESPRLIILAERS